MELYLIESIIIIVVIIQPLINSQRGIPLYAFKRGIIKSRPYLFILAMMQLFFVIIAIYKSVDLHITILLLVTFFVLVVVLFYEYACVKEGVFEKGIILNGVMYEWSEIKGYSIDEINSNGAVFQLKLINKRCSNRGALMNKVYAIEIGRLIDQKLREKT